MSSQDSFASYVISLHRLLIVTTLIFFLSLLIGFFGAQFFGIKLIASLREAFEPLISGLDAFQLMGLIFVNNSVKAFLALLLGLGIGVMPLLFVALNGWVLGVVVFEIEQVRGVAFLLAALLPHGVVELPAVLLSSTVGVRIGLEVIKKVRGNGNASPRRELTKGIKFFIYRILPLLFIAAAIESFVTPSVAGLFT